MSTVTMAEPESQTNHFVNGTVFPFDYDTSAAAVASHLFFILVQSDLPLLAIPLLKDNTYSISIREGSSRGPPTTVGQTSPSRPRFDPRQLLDPKGFNTIHRKKESDSFVDVSKSPPHTPTFEFIDGSQKRNQSDSEEYGMGNMIERVHNITERQERPHKRQKTGKDDDGEEERTKATFSGGGKGGEIGEFMKQKREEGEKESGPSKGVIDLTEGENYSSVWHAVDLIRNSTTQKMMRTMYYSWSKTTRRFATDE